MHKGRASRPYTHGYRGITPLGSPLASGLGSGSLVNALPPIAGGMEDVALPQLAGTWWTRWGCDFAPLSTALH